MNPSSLVFFPIYNFDLTKHDVQQHIHMPFLFHIITAVVPVSLIILLLSICFRFYFIFFPVYKYEISLTA